MRQVSTIHAVAGIGLLAAAALAVAATRTTGPVKMPAYTELRTGPLMEHLVTEAGLATAPVMVQHYYPGRVAPSISNIVARGFAPLYQVPDPQAAALPAEQAW